VSRSPRARPRRLQICQKHTVHFGGSEHERLIDLPVTPSTRWAQRAPVERVVKERSEHAVGEAFIVPPDFRG